LPSDARFWHPGILCFATKILRRPNMSHSAKRQYILAILERYQKSKKSEKKFILDEFCAICGYSRKYAIRRLNSPLELPTKGRGRRPRYGDEVIRHLIVLWHAMGRICSRRLKAALPEWIIYYESKDFSDETAKLLLEMSPATIDRRLRQERKDIGLSTTRPAK